MNGILRNFLEGWGVAKGRIDFDGESDSFMDPDKSFSRILQHYKIGAVTWRLCMNCMLL